MFLSRPRKFKHIYGPVSSWRLGRSLGVDVLPQKGKACTFNCLYCQLGSNPRVTTKRKNFIPEEDILDEIKRLPKSLKMDYITFSGYGEPSLARNLGELIKKIKRLRKEKVAVITNASLMRHRGMRKDLFSADLVLAKLDAYSEASFREINGPAKGIKFHSVVKGLKLFKKAYKGRFAIQIMFIPQNKNHFKKIAEIACAVMPDEIEINTPTRPNPVKALSRENISEITAYFRAYVDSQKIPIRITSVYEARRKRVLAINKKDTVKRRGAVV